MRWMRRRWRIMIARGGRHDAGHVPEASGFGRPWFALTVAFVLHVLDEASTGFLNIYNPTVTAMRARFALFPMPTFGFRAWLVGLMAGVALCFALTPLAARCPMASSAGMVLRACHVLQRPRAYRGDDPRAHGCKRARRATGAGILFFATAFHRIGVADGAIVEDGFQIPRSHPFVVLSSASWCEGLCSFLRHHRHCE
jgi:hypothetical protein